ncbi:MAG: hypothetical protein AAGE59_32685 [Cyanobacteria bacterium P01_F01_bin.86]
MPITLNLLPHTEPLLTVHQTDHQQPDNLCGPYCLSLLLRAYGALSVNAVDVAIAASTVLPSNGNPTDWLPPNASSLQSKNYHHISTHPNLNICGTSITGLIYATKILSKGKFSLIPLQIADWQTGLAKILKLCHTQPAIPLLNPHTSYFWGTHPSPLTLISYLDSKQISPPPTDWSVGHFNLLIGAAHQEPQTLYTLLDTYPQFGWQGLHFQPAAALSQSLHRPKQTTQGGLALFIKTELRPEIENLVLGEGFNISVWDNGSPVGPIEEPTPQTLPRGEIG